MAAQTKQQAYLKAALFWNGVADILASILLILFPALGLTLPGYGTLEYQAAFAAGGWGVIFSPRVKGTAT